MEIFKTTLQDALLIKTPVFGDHRGFFTESYTKSKFEKAGIKTDFVQDNHSLSVEPGVLRGLHFQTPPMSQIKLIRATSGVIYDVIVDIRLGSPTYGKWEGFILSEYNHHQLLIPEGFAHGFLTLTPNCNVQYKVDKYYSKENDGGIAFNDPDLNILWPMDVNNMILSDKDKLHPNLKQLENPFEYKEK